MNSLTGDQADFIQTSQIVSRIMPSHGTTLACSSCGRLEAPTYYLKRSHGRYALLCFDQGNGCWEHSRNSNCSYVDQHSALCMDLAEWVVAYGPDMLKERHVCSMHVPAVLGDAAEHRIFPLQDLSFRTIPHLFFPSVHPPGKRRTGEKTIHSSRLQSLAVLSN